MDTDPGGILYEVSSWHGHNLLPLPEWKEVLQRSNTHLTSKNAVLTRGTCLDWNTSPHPHNCFWFVLVNPHKPNLPSKAYDTYCTCLAHCFGNKTDQAFLLVACGSKPAERTLVAVLDMELPFPSKASRNWATALKITQSSWSHLLKPTKIEASNCSELWFWGLLVLVEYWQHVSGIYGWALP